MHVLTALSTILCHWEQICHFCFEISSLSQPDVPQSLYSLVLVCLLDGAWQHGMARRGRKQNDLWEPWEKAEGIIFLVVLTRRFAGEASWQRVSDFMKCDVSITKGIMGM